MFDPAAFDNMKVVIEGALYDKDLDGEIAITDRNDIFNIAKMSRMFNIYFSFPEIAEGILSAKIELEARFDNLAAELLSGSVSEKLAGCYVTLQFFIEHEDEINQYQAVQKIFSGVWGELRKITQTIEYNPLAKPQKVKNVVTIDFERLIREEQMDDLVEMTEFMLTTLIDLKTYFSNG
ncbi:hypothetical protein [Neobacillus kokaensis]|uniref:Group-specific protein n=1 Tax=Neobacillus kokaensis TaxID=2759023 RepID=A0ABQ3N012_9BACI|nr:hypothetical protein [Neobacillus kokaensis]GHH98264.1 hypothetical protein AM1BK_18070 [Neobacillus kokaensis]